MAWATSHYEPVFAARGGQRRARSVLAQADRPLWV